MIPDRVPPIRTEIGGYVNLYTFAYKIYRVDRFRDGVYSVMWVQCVRDIN